jgi:hypothetical protein
MTAIKSTSQPRKSAGRFLPLNCLIPSLPDTAQRFSKSHQSLQDFHQPLHGLIRRLKEFLQPPKHVNRVLENKAIYLQANQRVGQWSDVVSISVAG